MLVVCTNTEKLPMIQTTEFRKGGVYRHMEITEAKRTDHMVYGVIFSEKTFNECFKVYAPIIQERAKKLFYVNDKPITKKAFKELADVHQYGKLTTGVKVVYIGGSKENCFAIRPNQTDTKNEALNFAYDVMIDLCNGEVLNIDLGRVRWLNTGYPISMSYKFWEQRYDSEFTTERW